MSLPDLSQLQYYSGANSFKNDGSLYTGTLSLPATIAPHSFNQSTQSFTLTSAPQFSMLYAYFQEYLDAVQQASVGSGYNPPAWYQANVDNRIGITITGPPADAGVADASIYPIINGTTVTINLLVNNPYGDTISLAAQDIPWAFFIYTLTN